MQFRALPRHHIVAAVVTTLTGALLATGALSLAPGASAADSPLTPGHDHKVTTVTASDVDDDDTPDNVRDYWTANRLADAGGEDIEDNTLPAPGDILTPQGDKVGYGYPDQPYISNGTRGVGKIVMLNGTDRSNCSAAAIGQDLILTAAHCVLYDPTDGKLTTKLAFVPDYQHGKSDDGKNRDYEPFGIWPVTKTYMPTAYATDDDNAQDVAVMRVAPDRQGASLQDAIGISYNTLQSKEGPGEDSPVKAAVHGYPGQGGKKFDNGPEMFYCVGEFTADDQSPISELVTRNCAVQGGNSGGPLFDHDWNIIGVTQSGTRVTGDDGQPAENSRFARLHPETFGRISTEARRDTDIWDS